MALIKHNVIEAEIEKKQKHTFITRNKKLNVILHGMELVEALVLFLFYFRLHY